MRPFTYVRPSGVDAAIDATRAADALLIAGGTGVVDLLRLGVENPAHLVDVNALDWGRVEELPEGGLRIGALVKNSDLSYHPQVVAHFPALAEALLAGASPQIRNMASVGGNLLQRTRCSYFRDVGVSQCNKRSPGSGCAALEGVTRMHAVLGVSDRCIAAHPSDMCVALAALDATVDVQGPAGARAIAIGDFHALPGTQPEVENALKRGEIVKSLTLPKTAFAGRSVYVKARDRASFAFALASAAVALDLDGDTVRDVRVALGGVGTKPWRSHEAEDVLRGKQATAASFALAANAALAAAQTRPGNAFKVELARRVVVRALERASAHTAAGPSGASK